MYHWIHHNSEGLFKACELFETFKQVSSLFIIFLIPAKQNKVSGVQREPISAGINALIIESNSLKDLVSEAPELNYFHADIFLDYTWSRQRKTEVQQSGI